MTNLDELHRLMEVQHGVVSRAQLLLLGFTPDMIYERLQSGRWTADSSRVIGLPGAPHTASRSAMTAVLDAGSGAILSHRSSAASWGVPGYILEPFDVLAPRGGLRLRDSIAIVHLSRCIPAHHIKVLDGVPLTSPTRTLFDLAGLPDMHPLKLARSVDNAWGKRLTTGPLLHDMLDELRGRGRRGIGLMREVLAARGRDYLPPESSLERRFHALLAEDGQAPMDRQVNLGGDQWLARVDAYDWSARVIAQVHSDRYHRALLDRQHDDAQLVALIAAGFVIVEVWEEEVWYRGDIVKDRVRRARAAGRLRWRDQPWQGRIRVA
jgi:hypothetical protein